jgi:hypothetical protein
MYLLKENQTKRALPVKMKHSKRLKMNITEINWNTKKLHRNNVNFVLKKKIDGMLISVKLCGNKRKVTFVQFSGI